MARGIRTVEIRGQWYDIEYRTVRGYRPTMDEPGTSTTTEIHSVTDNDGRVLDYRDWPTTEQKLVELIEDGWA